jgi:hypothetical protein
VDAERFWTILKTAKGSVVEVSFDGLQQELSRLDPKEMVAFFKQYQNLIAGAYKAELWGAAYLINGGCSDDGFHDFLVWLVGQGEEVYRAAIVDPDSLAQVRGPEDMDTHGSALDAAALRAWQEKTGRREEEFFEQLDKIDNPPTTFQLQGEDWDFDDNAEMRRRLPRLSGIFLPSEG